MKNIVRTICISFCFLCVWYLFFFGLSYLYSDEPPAGNFLNEKTTILKMEGTRAALGAWKRRSPGQKIFLLGASNVRMGFNRYVMQNLFPKYVTYDMTVGAANVTAMQDAFSIAQMTGKSLKGSCVVVGIWYGSFNRDAVPKPLGAIKSEALRHGLYKLNGDRLELSIDPKYMPFAVSLLRPFLFCETLLTDTWQRYNDWWVFVRNGFKPNLLDNPNASDPKYRQEAINQFFKAYKSVDHFTYDEQSQKLKDLCKTILASGARLIVVDMPLPQWHRDGSAFYKRYFIKRSEFIPEIQKLPGTTYLDLTSYLPDSEFQDFTHTNKDGAWHLSRRLLEVINHV